MQSLYKLYVETPTGDIIKQYVTEPNDVVRWENEVDYATTYETNSQSYTIRYVTIIRFIHPILLTHILADVLTGRPWM